MNFKDIAEDYMMAGFSPIPLKKDKSPAIASLKPYFDEIQDDLTPFGSCDKIGVACGNVSENLILIDFDRHQGQDIKSRFIAYTDTEQFRLLIKNKQVATLQTPSSGYHIYVRSEDPDIKSRVLAKYPDGHVMIETKGNGGYACTYPSQGYKFLKGAKLTELRKVEPHIVDYLIERAITLNEFIADEKVKENKGSGSWPEKFDTTTPEGRCNEIEEDLIKDLLIEKGWTRVVYPYDKKDSVEKWRRPGKDEGVSATYGHLKGMFYAFTSTEAAIAPLKGSKAYNHFNLLTELKFNGDWKSSRDWLRERYKMPKFGEKKFEIAKDEIHVTPIEDEDEEIKLLDFPVDVFPEFMQNIIQELNSCLNYKKDILGAAMMYATSTIIGNRFKAHVLADWKAPCIFWFAVTGESGTQKSHPVNTILKPLKKMDKESKEVYDNQYREYEANDRKGKRPQFMQTIVNDSTLEALHRVHQINKRGIGLYKDELVGFLNDMNKYRKGSDEQFWLESFNNDQYTINRVTSEPIVLSNIFINIIGGIQSGVLADVASKQTENGLLQRFLFTVPENNIFPISRIEPNPVIFSVWHEFLKHLAFVCTYEGKTDFVHFDEESKELFHKFDEEIVKQQNDPNIDKQMKSYLSKMRTYVPRFALLLAVIDAANNPEAFYLPTINRDNMEGAKKCVEYFISTARKVFIDNEQKQEFNDINYTMKGKSKAEKVIHLFEKGYKQKKIADNLRCTPAYVSKILAEKKKKVNQS